MKNFKKSGILILILLVITLFAGCQTDEGPQNSAEEKSDNANIGVTETCLTLKDLDMIPEAKVIIEKITEEKKTDPSGKSVYNPEYDFFVNTDKILRLDNGKYHSLTFSVFRLQKDNGITENLVLSLQDNGKYLVALYKYKLSNQEKTFILNNQLTDIQGYVSRTVLQNFNPDDVTARIVQVWYTEVILKPCSSGDHNSKNFGDWHKCNLLGNNKPQILTITRSLLLEVGNDPVGIGSEIGSSRGGGGGGNGGYTPPPFDPGKDMNLIKGGLTKPFINIETEEEKFYNKFLDDDERAAMQFSDFRKPILKFLKERGWTENNKSLAKMLLNEMYKGSDIEFLNWAIEYITNNPLVTPDLLKGSYIEDKITSQNLDNCSQSVLEQLKILSESDIAKMISKLDSDPSIYKLDISTGNNGTLNPANTIRTPGYPKHNYVMRLNPDYFGPNTAFPSNKLFRASIILHELIHAYFLSLVDDVSTGVPGASEEMAVLFEAYVVKNFGPNAQAMHHQIMADKYVDILAKALQEYNTGLPVEGKPKQIYSDLAWGGLKEAPIFNTTNQLSNSDRARIIARYGAEGYNRTNQGETPIGKPCN